jgi:hypothetical protein
VKHSITHHALRFTFHVLRCAFLLLLLAPTPTHAAQETVAVTGHVINGSPGGAVPEGLPVTLHVFTVIEEAGTYTAAVAADGSFRFDGLTLVGGERLIARAIYQGVDYYSEIATFEPGQQEIPLSVTIYDTTDDSGDVQVAKLHIFLDVETDRLWVAEHYQIGNTGDRAYAGTLLFTLPEGALNLRLDGGVLGERFLEREEGFADTRPVPPGPATGEVFFSYELPYQEGMSIERVFRIPVASAALVIPDEGIVLQGAGLTSDGRIDTDMGPALSYAAGPLAAGETLTFSLGKAIGEQKSGGAAEIVVGLTALVVAAGAAYLLWRSPASGPLPARMRPLVEAIAALDTDFEAGQLAEKTYRQERERLGQEIRVALGKNRDAEERGGQ